VVQPPAEPTVTLVVPQAVQLAPDATVSATAEPVNDLRTQVGSLVDAMQAFNSGAAAPGAATQVAALTAPAVATTTLVAPVVSLVDALKQFDANGQPLGTVAMPAVSTAVTLNTTLPPKPGTDILAPSK
jgi:hypothetical protein